MYDHKWWLCWKISVQYGKELNFLHSDITVIILHGQILILYNWRPYLSITPRSLLRTFHFSVHRCHTYTERVCELDLHNTSRSSGISISWQLSPTVCCFKWTVWCLQYSSQRVNGIGEVILHSRQHIMEVCRWRESKVPRIPGTLTKWQWINSWRPCHYASRGKEYRTEKITLTWSFKVCTKM